MHAVFEQVDSLPGPEQQAAAGEGNGQRNAGQQRTRMGGHVVVAFEIVAIARIAIGRPALQQRFEVAAHRRIGVFGDRQPATGVADEDVGNSGVDRGSPDDGGNFTGDFGGPAAAGNDGQAMLFAHGRRPCAWVMR